MPADVRVYKGYLNTSHTEYVLFIECPHCFSLLRYLTQNHNCPCKNILDQQDCSELQSHLDRIVSYQIAFSIPLYLLL